jgi:hypothetical protein
MTMGRSCGTDVAPLLDKMPTPSVPKYPLGLFPPSVRPYLELIRLEKVSHANCVCVVVFLTPVDKPTGTKLMFWPFCMCAFLF